MLWDDSKRDLYFPGRANFGGGQITPSMGIGQSAVVGGCYRWEQLT